MHNNITENLSSIISKLPGMGPRIARRIVLELATNKEKILKKLIENLKDLDEKVHNCKNCGNLGQADLCEICSNEKREQSIICIVEEISDLMAIERTQNYQGKYHVLGGNLSAISGKTFEDLNIESLYQRLKVEPIKEVIIATSATIDGQTTAHFIAQNLKEFNVKITRLTHGIPIGSELDYLDEGTIAIAFKTRSEF